MQHHRTSPGPNPLSWEMPSPTETSTTSHTLRNSRSRSTTPLDRRNEQVTAFNRYSCPLPSRSSTPMTAMFPVSLEEDQVEEVLQLVPEPQLERPTRQTRQTRRLSSVTISPPRRQARHRIPNSSSSNQNQNNPSNADRPPPAVTNLESVRPSGEPVNTAPPLSAPTPSKNGTSIIWKLLKTLRITLYTLLFIWAGLMVVAYASDTLLSAREYFTPTPPIPLPYIAWSTGSNAVHCRDLIKQTTGLRNHDFFKGGVMSSMLADEVQKVGHYEYLAKDLLLYRNRSDSLRFAMLELHSKTTVTVAALLEDIQQSQALVKKLRKTLPHDPSGTRRSELENKLVGHVEKLHSVRLPKHLKELFQAFLNTEARLNELADIAARVRGGLSRSDELMKALQLTPSRVWKFGREDELEVQRRAGLGKGAMESLSKLEGLITTFSAAQQTLSGYSKSLELFQSPRYMKPYHRRSNGTLEDFLHLMDEVIPELVALTTQRSEF